MFMYLVPVLHSRKQRHYIAIIKDPTILIYYQTGSVENGDLKLTIVKNVDDSMLKMNTDFGRTSRIPHHFDGVRSWKEVAELACANVEHLLPEYVQLETINAEMSDSTNDNTKSTAEKTESDAAPPKVCFAKQARNSKLLVLCVLFDVIIKIIIVRFSIREQVLVRQYVLFHKLSQENDFQLLSFLLLTQLRWINVRIILEKMYNFIM